MSAGTGKTRAETAIGLAITLLAAAFSKFLGLYLLFMVIGVGSVAFLAPHFLSARSKGFIASFSLQAGQLLVITVAALVSFGFSPALGDVVVFGAGLLWLAVKPGRGPVIYLIIAQVLGTVWNGYRLVDAFSATDWVQAVPAPTVDLIVRLLAILLLVLELRAFREAQAAAAQPAELVAATALPEREDSAEGPQPPGPERSSSRRAPRRGAGALAIVSAVLLAAGLAAWPVRWETGPTETVNGTKVVHLRDRWTDQGWARLYRGVELGGELQFVPVKSTLEQKERDLLNSPAGYIERQAWQAAVDRMAYLDKSADLYEQWALAGRERLINRGTLPQNAPSRFAVSFGASVGERFPEYEAAIAVPAGLLDSQDALRAELSMLLQRKDETPEKWAAQEARDELTAEAQQAQQLAVEIWLGLLGATLVSTGLSLWFWLRVPVQRALPRSTSAS